MLCVRGNCRVMSFELDFGEHAGNSIAPRLTKFDSKQPTLALRVFPKKVKLIWGPRYASSVAT